MNEWRSNRPEYQVNINLSGLFAFQIDLSGQIGLNFPETVECYQGKLTGERVIRSNVPEF